MSNTLRVQNRSSRLLLQTKTLTGRFLKLLLNRTTTQCFKQISEPNYPQKSLTLARQTSNRCRLCSPWASPCNTCNRHLNRSSSRQSLKLQIRKRAPKTTSSKWTATKLSHKNPCPSTAQPTLPKDLYRNAIQTSAVQSERNLMQIPKPKTTMTARCSKMMCLMTDLVKSAPSQNRGCPTGSN